MIYTQTKINTGLIGFLILVATIVLFIFPTIPANNKLNKLKLQQLPWKGAIPIWKKELAGEIQSDSFCTHEREVDPKDLSASEFREKLEQDVIINTLNITAKTADVACNAANIQSSTKRGYPIDFNINRSFRYGVPI